MNNFNKQKQKKNLIVIIPLLLLILLVIGGSYAWLRLSITGDKTNKIVAGSLQLTLDDEASNGISLDKAIPMSDKDGLATTEYTFTLKNSGTINSDYTIYLDDEALDANDARMLDKYVKYSLVKNSDTITDILTTTGVNPNRVLDTDTIVGGATNTYSLRVWIDSSADNKVMNTVFKTKLRIEANQVKTETSSKNVSFTPSNSEWNVGSVEEALDYLFEQ